MRDEYVSRRRWIQERDFAYLVSLCQFLPGPASSQLGIAIGAQRAGLLGSFAAWLGFTIPSAAAMTALALIGGSDLADDGWVQGLKLVAVAVVAQAVWNMGRTLTPDVRRATLALAAAVATLVWPQALTQLAVIGVGALLGRLILQRRNAGATTDEPVVHPGIGRRTALVALALFAVLLVALPLARHATESHAVAMADGYYRSGALVFGGGHVVLPLLEQRVVDPGWVSESDFLAGYGAAQAVPGPLFTVAAYLGAVQEPAPSAVPGAAIALVAIFLPGALLVLAALPFWSWMRTREGALTAIAGVNAAVVGILLAALYNPVITGSIDTWPQAAIAAVALGTLTAGRAPVWAVVLGCGAAGWAFL